MRLQGKVAIITGGASGLGEASVKAFCAEGAAVVVVDRDGDGADRVVEEVAAVGGTAVAMQADVTDETALAAVAKGTLDRFGPTTTLFANAGIPGSGRAGDISVDDWDKVIAVNLTSVWLSSRAVLPQMIDNGGGSIINQASVGGLVGVGGIASYAAAKAGVIGLTRQMAVDYGPSGIRVNAICPGTVPTPLVRKTYEEGGGFASTQTTPAGFDEMMERNRARYPIGKIGKPENIAMMAVYLASDESEWTTGTVIPVDGGMTAW